MPKGKKNLETLELKFEIKQILEEEDGFFRFEGLASTFNNVDLTDDLIEPGAFKKSLEKQLPIILWQHASDEPIGMPEVVEETPEGLFIRARLPKDDTLVSGRVIPQIKVGSIRTMSIGFRWPRGGTFEIDSDGIRRLKEIDLVEISLVTFAANPKAKITDFKSLVPFFDGLGLTEDKKQELLEKIKKEEFTVNKDDLLFLDDLDKITARGLESALRDSGLFTKNAAVKMVSFLNRSDSENDDSDAVLNELKALSVKAQNISVQAHIKSMLNKIGE